jgi:hypothetical protein
MMLCLPLHGIDQVVRDYIGSSFSRNHHILVRERYLLLSQFRLHFAKGSGSVIGSSLVRAQD